MAATVAQEEQPISRTYQYRKVMKPMLERKRRARINRCLDELKELLVGALQAEGESVSRLEKADVLELTVRHLHKLRRSQQLSESSSGESFRQGFVHCANEVSKYISSAAPTPSIDHSVSTRLVSHLHSCITSIESSQLQHHAQLIHPGVMPPPNMPPGSQLSPGYQVVPGAMMSPSVGGSGPSSGTGPGGLNILTSYTPPSSPVSSSSSSPSSGSGSHQKLYYIPRASSSASSTGSLSPIPPAHYNPQLNMYAAHAARGGGPQPLSLTKSQNPDEPYDLSNSMWRPW